MTDLPYADVPNARQSLEQALGDARRQRAQRINSAVVGGAGLAVLVVAAWLTPSASGHSTHTQLGLLPCTFLAITGFPCPMCGATTSWALMADLRVVEAFHNQPFAAGLFLLTAVVSGISLTEAVLPRGRWTRIAYALRPYELPLAVGFLLAMMAGWIWKVVLMRWA